MQGWGEGDTVWPVGGDCTDTNMTLSTAARPFLRVAQRGLQGAKGKAALTPFPALRQAGCWSPHPTPSLRSSWDPSPSCGPLCQHTLTWP